MRLVGCAWVAVACLLAACSAEAPAPKVPAPLAPAPAGATDPAAAPVNGKIASTLRAFEGLEGTVSIAGGTAHIPVMEKAGAAISGMVPKVKVTVAGGGTGVGVKQVGEGLVDIGNTGRPLTDEERKAHGLLSYAFAIDGVAVVVHPANQLGALTTAQVKDLFAGKITDWKDVGGAAGPVHLFTRDEASGTREVFWTILLAKGAVADRAVVVASNGAMKTAVAGDPGALGYASIGHVDATVKALDLDGVAPTQENAASGKYVVTRKLFMNTKGAPKPLVKAFIDYVFSPEGMKFTRDAGYIPIPAAK